MTLAELFAKHGDPSKTYSNALVADFYAKDDGTWFGEALAEMSEADRARIASMIDDKTSRSLSHQMIGAIVTEQLIRYPKAYLQKKYDDWNSGDAQGCMP